MQEGARKVTPVQEEREPALEPGSAGAHEDSHSSPLFVALQADGGMIPRGQEEEGEDEGIIHTSQLTTDSP